MISFPMSWLHSDSLVSSTSSSGPLCILKLRVLYVKRLCDSKKLSSRHMVPSSVMSNPDEAVPSMVTAMFFTDIDTLYYLLFDELFTIYVHSFVNIALSSMPIRITSALIVTVVYISLLSLSLK